MLIYRLQSSCHRLTASTCLCTSSHTKYIQQPLNMRLLKEKEESTQRTIRLIRRVRTDGMAFKFKSGTQCQFAKLIAIIWLFTITVLILMTCYCGCGCSCSSSCLLLLILSSPLVLFCIHISSVIVIAY